MTHDIRYANFIPTDDEKVFLNRRLSVLEDSCPDQSYVLVHVDKLADQYSIKISVRHFGGHLHEEVTEPNLGMCVKKCLDGMFHQVREWRGQRFNEPFQLSIEKISPQESQPIISKESIRVLIIDDDLGSTTILKSIFDRAGYHTHVVMDSFKAVQEVRKNMYDLIVLDWCLPYLDGGEVIRHADSNISLGASGPRKIPVITCSGMAREDIHLPLLKNFQFVDHWDKSSPFSSIFTQASELLPEIKKLRVA